MLFLPLNMPEIGIFSTNVDFLEENFLRQKFGGLLSRGHWLQNCWGNLLVINFVYWEMLIVIRMALS